MTRESHPPSDRGTKAPGGRIVDVPPDSKAVTVATHRETLEFIGTLRAVALRHSHKGKRAQKRALRDYVAGLEPEEKKKLIRGIMAALPGPRPHGG